MTRRTRVTSAAVAGCAATLLLGLAAPSARAEAGLSPVSPVSPVSPASVATAHRAASDPATLDTLARFFADPGSSVTESTLRARVDDDTVPVYYLSPDFVAGRTGAPVARLAFLATRAVASDGRKASLWTARQGGGWQLVNIASGDDETRYAALGARLLPGGTVFREPQIDAWYVERHARVLPLDTDARQAIGARGTTLASYRARVHKAYADKLPGSVYARSGEAGGYGSESPGTGRPHDHPENPGPAVAIASAAAGVGALVALTLSVSRALRRRRR
ncbi:MULTISPECIES: hypothetical protein [unclassified Streptomyces]|uniref:hypothetical protein n=1 Tax=unclassified Streptomyces TaxID=2593676 RepID=UPI002E8213C1|nr:hypothetical protein [Streptomyces sp. NBC_00589]WTI40086.1 hypothetical protein OIC96_36415 [Streptomyces sp. NBC_00775]WUB26233.1 hypothetical protein OHA51_13315 [Streptomyces sp. NBC_00589]